MIFFKTKVISGISSPLSSLSSWKYCNFYNNIIYWCLFIDLTIFIGRLIITSVRGGWTSPPARNFYPSNGLLSPRNRIWFRLLTLQSPQKFASSTRMLMITFLITCWGNVVRIVFKSTFLLIFVGIKSILKKEKLIILREFLLKLKIIRRRNMQANNSYKQTEMRKNIPNFVKKYANLKLIRSIL